MSKASQSLKIGLFGGSFNPPTIAHFALAQHARNALQLDQLWWLVAPHNPDKPQHTLAPFADRLAMCELIAGEHFWLHVSDLEDRLGTQQTSDTLQGILARHPHDRFVWLMGTDNLLHFHAWDRWLDITGAVPIAVFARPGEVTDALAAPAVREMGSPQPHQHAARLQPGQWTLFANEQMAVSATKVREAVRTGQTSDHVAPEVAGYIQDHLLYRAG